MSFLLFLSFLFNKIGEQEGWTGSAQKWEWGWSGEWNGTLYTHVSNVKCKKVNK
jgi:hypothetical protein